MSTEDSTEHATDAGLLTQAEILEWGRARQEEQLARLNAAFPVAFDLFYSILEGTVEDVRERLNAGDAPNALSSDGRTPLFYAVRYAKDLPKASLLLAAGAQLDTWDNFGWHPLHCITNSCAIGSEREDELNCLSYVLDLGADPCVAVVPASGIQFDPIGWTPLHIATYRGGLLTLELLLKRGADANRASADGSTPLHVAASSNPVYKRLMRDLLDAGANPNAVTTSGRTALHELAWGTGKYRKSAIRLLLSRGAHADLKDVIGRLPVDELSEGYPESEDIKRLLHVKG